MAVSEGGSNREGTIVPLPQEHARLGTGNAAFDLVLSGGIPRNSLSLISGPPGAGKTVLGLQMAFNAARNGMRVIYFTNVSEPHAKLVANVSTLDFYSPELIGDRIQIYNITSQVRNRGFKETLDFIVDTVRSERAGLMVIDSFRGLKHVLQVGSRERGAIFDLAAQLSILGCTSLLIGEYTDDESRTEPEFAVADGIIHLYHATIGVQDRRWMRVVKMRGIGYLGGEHTFTISHKGMNVFPRQETLSQSPPYRATMERVMFGLERLDMMLGGGLLRSSSTLLAGSSGAGKTLLSLQFLAEGVAIGERGLMISFQENREQLQLRGQQFGMGSLGLERGETLVLALSPIELDMDVAATQIREAVEQHNIRRVVIDSIAELEFASRDPERFDDFVASLVGYLRGREITTLMTREITQVFGSELAISSRGLSFVVDNIILLRYFEMSGRIHRMITVLKSRGSEHDHALRELTFENGAINIGDQIAHMSGVLSGLPRLTSATPVGGGEEVS